MNFYTRRPFAAQVPPANSSFAPYATPATTPGVYAPSQASKDGMALSTTNEAATPLRENMAGAEEEVEDGQVLADNQNEYANSSSPSEHESMFNTYP